jgi:hypothetical protein
VLIEGLVFAGLATADPGALARFFGESLGAETVAEDGYTRVVFPNGSSLALVPSDWIPPPSDTNLGFLVDDLVVATAELGARGVEPDGGLTEAAGLRYQHFRMPDGRVFELIDRRG